MKEWLVDAYVSLQLQPPTRKKASRKLNVKAFETRLSNKRWKQQLTSHKVDPSISRNTEGPRDSPLR